MQLLVVNISWYNNLPESAESMDATGSVDDCSPEADGEGSVLMSIVSSDLMLKPSGAELVVDEVIIDGWLAVEAIAE